MAHFAVIDQNNKVIQVITGREDNDPEYWESYYSSKMKKTCKRTSYNTVGGVHKLGGTPFRKNFAGIDYVYDIYRDAFIPPKPFNSWTLNEETCLWEAPTPMPQDGTIYIWDEITLSWKQI
jgi:hypothetical protein